MAVRRGTRIGIAATGIAVVIAAIALSGVSSADSASLSGCSFDPATRIQQCVIPTDPPSVVTVTQDPVTSTVTSTPDPVTVTASGSTVTSSTTAFGTVTVTKTTAKGTVTVTASPSSTAAPTTSTQPVTTPSTTSAAPTTVSTTPVSSSGFPDATNTGVPAGIALTPYTGPMTITANNTIVDSKTITGALLIRATGVTVKNSKVNGRIDSDNGGSVTILDTEINDGTDSVAGVTQDNVTMRRVNVHGGRQSITCGSNCDIQDSWLHGQVNANSSWHDNGYISNGGSNVLLQHNSIACEAPGDVCTGPVAFFGDFDPIANITVNNNLILSSSSNGTLLGAYCLYGGYEPSKSFPNPTNVHITNNVFQKGTGKGQKTGAYCAYYGAVTSLGTGNGNTYSGNVFDDGSPVN